jgi:hypothetical protein
MSKIIQCPECGKPLFQTRSDGKGMRLWCTNTGCTRFGIALESEPPEEKSKTAEAEG